MPGVATQTSAMLAAAQHSATTRRTSSHLDRGDDGFANLLDAQTPSRQPTRRSDDAARPSQAKEADRPAQDDRPAKSDPRDTADASNTADAPKTADRSEAKGTEAKDHAPAKADQATDDADPKDAPDTKSADALIVALTATPAKADEVPTTSPDTKAADAPPVVVSTPPAVAATPPVPVAPVVPVPLDPTSGPPAAQPSAAVTGEIAQITGITNKTGPTAFAAAPHASSAAQPVSQTSGEISAPEKAAPPEAALAQPTPTETTPDAASNPVQTAGDAPQPHAAKLNDKAEDKPDQVATLAVNRAELATSAPDAATPSSALAVPAATQTSVSHATSPANAVQAAQPASVPIAGLPVEIAASAKAGINSFDIRLDPVELGRIQVHLELDRSGQVHSHITADNAQTLDLLRRDAPQLERALQDAGFKTGDGAMQFSLRDQSLAQQHNQPNDQQSGMASQRAVIPDDDMAPVMAVQSYGRLSGLNSGVDIRV